VFARSQEPGPVSPKIESGLKPVSIVPSRSREPSPGTVLGGKYRIEQVLGSGGIAVVAAAYHLQLRCRVAIKYLLPEALDYPEIVERFAREARAAARLRGEHVVRVIDVGVFADGAPYIVLEYLEGMDLAELLTNRGPLPVREAVRYILQACEGLAEAHSANVVHRDLKPANLFLAKGPDRRRKIKVIDFGVSKILDEPMTDPARVLGTVVYMPPEQLHTSSNVDARADIWSLGVILYELLAGRPPFMGRTVVTVAQRIGANSPPSLFDVRPDVPLELEELIVKCMSTDPEERPQTIFALATALGRFVDSRDRDSVRAISAMVHGSVPPPGGGLDSGALPVLENVPSPALMPAADPAMRCGPVAAVPAPVESSAPVATPIQNAVSRPEGGRRLATSVIPRTLAAVLASALLAAVVAARFLNSGPVAAPATPVVEAIALHLSTTIPHATVRIDDKPPQPLPADVHVPRDFKEHVLRVEAAGYETRTRTVTFDSDVRLMLSLTPLDDRPSEQK
jgi:serine/threonine-protein kinase